MIDYPMSTLEQELRRVYALFDGAVKKLNLTYWPADGTFLGILREGCVANDLDLDFEIVTSREGCGPVLHSVVDEFKKVANVYWSTVVEQKTGINRGTVMYGMIRMHRLFGYSKTGADFACAYLQPDNSLAMLDRVGLLKPLAAGILPLVPCRVSELTFLCPGSGSAVLSFFAPHYNGCIVLPHCFGDPETGTSRCGTPHRPVPLKALVQATQTLERCNYGNLADHYRTYPYCPQLMLEKNILGAVTLLAALKLTESNTVFLKKKFMAR